MKKKKSPVPRRKKQTLRSAPRSGSKSSKAAAHPSPRRATARRAGGSPTIEQMIESGGTVIKGFSSVRFAGVALGGGKTDKTAVAILEFYPDQKRVFLRSLRDKVSGKGEVSADEMLVSVLTEEEKDLRTITFDVPLQLPICFRCRLDCPGAEKCSEPALKWMRDMHRLRDKHKRPNKMFTPYTERAAEIYISNELEEPFHPSHAMGANAAPLTARAHCLKRRLSGELVEAYPKLSIWRIGNALDVPKSHLRFHKHAVDSDEARLYILKTLIDKDIAFVYQQDMRLMVDNNVAFEAFICALTGFLKYRGQTEKRPANFPKGELWIDFPKQKIQWF